MSATRWIERHDSVIVFLQLYHLVIAALEEVSSWQDRGSSTNAQQLSISVQQSQFLVALFCLNKVYNFKSDLSKALQSKSMNLVECVELATNVQEELEDMRENALLVFSEMYQEIQVVASQIDLELKKPRLVPSQRNRSNVQSETVEDYYRVSVFIPLIDCFICELKARFENHKSIWQGFYSLLSKETAINGSTVVQIKNIKDLANFYSNDIDKDQSGVEAELKLWFRHLSKLDTRPHECNSSIFFSIYKLLKILVTMPVTTCTSERSFSTLRRLKTYLRNSIGAERLNGLALLNIFHGMTPTPEQVMSQFSKSP